MQGASWGTETWLKQRGHLCPLHNSTARGMYHGKPGEPQVPAKAKDCDSLAAVLCCFLVIQCYQKDFVILTF